MNSSQLSIFDQSPPGAEAPTKADALGEVLTVEGYSTLSRSLSPGDRIRVTEAGSPLEYLNGRLGKILSMKSDLASVQVEGIAVAITLRIAAIEKYSEASHFIHEDESQLIEVGCSVESDFFFVGRVGIVRRIEPYCGGTVAWVDYGSDRPWYPASIERLSLT